MRGLQSAGRRYLEFVRELVKTCRESRRQRDPQSCPLEAFSMALLSRQANSVYAGKPLGTSDIPHELINAQF